MKGVTTCWPHDNRMPCAKCGEELLGDDADTDTDKQT